MVAALEKASGKKVFFLL